MRRILTSSALLAACLIMAACGSSSSNTPTDYLASLNGTWVFQEQVYTYYSGAQGVHAPTSMTGKALHSVKAVGQREKALAVMHKSFSKAHAVPAQGNVYSNVAWGGVVGSLEFDGQGDVIGGEIDYNEPTGGGYYSDTLSGVYTVNSDGSGTLSLLSNNVGATFYFEFGLQGLESTNPGGPASGGQIVEGEEDDLGDIEIGTGSMLPQTGTLSQGSINGNYVFGMQGQTCYGSPCPQINQGDLYTAGLFAANGSGSFGTGTQADVSDGFASGNLTLNGTYVAPDTQGRATASLTTTGGDTYDAGALPTGYVFYIANPTTFFILSTDNNNTSNGLSPYLFGQANLQTGSFSNATLSGPYVMSESTEDLQNENSNTPDTYSDTYLALLASGGGTLTGIGDSNKAGTVTTSVVYNYGAFTVASNGRVTLTGNTPSGAPAPVFWLQSSGFGYGVDQLNYTTTQQPGLLSLYQQSGSSFTNSSFSGSYALGTLPASTSLAQLAVGMATPDGNGNLSGDIGVASLNNNPINSATASYTISATGHGTTTGAGNSLFGDGVLYVVSPQETLFMGLNSQNTAPSIQIMKQ